MVLELSLTSGKVAGLARLQKMLRMTAKAKQAMVSLRDDEQSLLAVFGQETQLRDPSLCQGILILLYIHNTADPTLCCLLRHP